MMNIYNYEHNDKLSESLQKTKISYSSEILITEDIYNQIELSQASKKDINRGTLFDYSSILASCGWNANDDVFDKDELWLAKDSPIHQKVNFEHDETDIIGVIKASLPVDNSNNIIESPIDDYNILVASSLYTVWDDESLQGRMDTLIEEIPQGLWYVSMECYFNNFDYAITKGNESSIIKRNAETAYLTKHLRAYGGTGEYNGYRVGRLLRNYKFVGKGVVKTPANKKSKILNIFKTTAELKMDNVEQLKADLASAKTELAKANSSISDLQKQIQSQVTLSEIKEKDKAIAELNDLNAKLTESNGDLTASVNSLQGELEAKLNEYTVASSKNDELTKVIAQYELDKKIANRLSKLTTAGVESVEAQALVDSWIDSSDEQFESIVKLALAAIKKEVSTNETPDLSTASLETSKVVTSTVVDTEDNCFVKAAKIFQSK